MRSKELGAGELRSEFVETLRADGVAKNILVNCNEDRRLGGCLRATELGAYKASFAIPFLFIHLSIFSACTACPRNLKPSSPFSVSTSFLRCRFRTIAFISLGLTFLSKPQLLIRDLYCLNLGKSARITEDNGWTTYVAEKPDDLNSVSTICFTSGSGKFCLI